MSTVCPLYDQYGESLVWIFTEPLGTCVYNMYDKIAFIVGWLSVLSWTFALLPQIITNCKNKAAESQSFWFWLLWLVGDFCNFGGCILTKNLITNIALALVYLSFTAFACLQFIWYEYLLKKYNFTKQQKAYNRNQLLLFGASHSKSKSHSFDCSPSTHAKLKFLYETHYQIKGSDATIWNTPNFARRYSAPPNNALMSPKLKKTLKILSRSPRMFALSSQLTKRMRREYEALQAQKREQEHHLFPEQDIEHQQTYRDLTASDIIITASNSSSRSVSSHKDTEKLTLNMDNSDNKSKSIIKISEDYSCITPRHSAADAKNNNMVNTSQLLNKNSIGSSNISNVSNVSNMESTSIEIQTDPTNSAPLRVSTNPNYGSMSTIMSTLSSMSITIVMLYGINNYDNHNRNYNNNISPHRILLNNNNNNSNSDILMTIGMILGWTSSIIYISSRIPQLKLMMDTKAVSGINPAFFCLTFSGNLTQCLSMLINRQIYSNSSDLFSKLPWLASSSVCIFQDGLILFLIYLYNTDHYKSLSHIKHNLNLPATCSINATYESCSKGVMKPSPHYLITNDEIYKKHMNENMGTLRKQKKKKKRKKKRKSMDTLDRAMNKGKKNKYKKSNNRKSYLSKNETDKHKDSFILTNTV